MSDLEHSTDAKAVRDYAASLKRKLTATEARVADLERQIADRVLTEHLGGFRNPDLVEQSLRDDGVDLLDQSAVERWIAANGGDFAQAAPAEIEPLPIPEQSFELTPEQEQFERFLEATGQAAWSAPSERQDR